MSWTIWALIVLYVVPAVFCLLGALCAARLASDCAKEAFLDCVRGDDARLRENIKMGAAAKGVIRELLRDSFLPGFNAYHFIVFLFFVGGGKK